MLRRGRILAVFVICTSTITAFAVFASAEEGLIPAWIKNSAKFWVEGDVSDQEFITSIEWMIENNLLQTSVNEENALLEDENKRLQAEIDELYDIYVYDSSYDSGYSSYDYDPAPTSGRVESQECDGYADCFSGEVNEIIDGDTIKIAGKSIRFALVDTPEIGEYGYTLAKNFVASICPVGSIALVDEDDGQTQGSYGRMIAVVYCNGMNLNKAVLDQGYGVIDTYFCSQSEFEYHSWAQLHGCEYEDPEILENGCHIDYPYLWSDGMCYNLPEYLNNGCPRDYPYLWSDGMCYYFPEPVQEQAPEPEEEQSSCDPSYPTVCIPPYPPDLDCGEITYKNFLVVGSDPHGFDGDGDGIGCES
jgi:micrococcal nuclease